MIKKRFFKEQKGSVFVEFVITLPLLISIFIGSLSILNTMKVKHDNTTIARSINKMIDDDLTKEQIANILTEFRKEIDVLVRRVACKDICEKESEDKVFGSNNVDDKFPSFSTSLYDNIQKDEISFNEDNSNNILNGGRYTERFKEIIICYNDNFVFRSKEKFNCDTFVF